MFSVCATAAARSIKSPWLNHLEPQSLPRPIRRSEIFWVLEFCSTYVPSLQPGCLRSHYIIKEVFDVFVSAVVVFWFLSQPTPPYPLIVAVGTRMLHFLKSPPHTVKQFVQQRLLHRLLDRVWRGLTVCVIVWRFSNRLEFCYATMRLYNNL